MPRTTDARRRMVGTALRLFQRQGYAATGLAEVIADSGAPKGSFYFHFPGGKEQLGVEAIDAAGRITQAAFARLAEPIEDPAKLVRALAAAQAHQLAESGYTAGCPVATVVLETAHVSEPLRRAGAEAVGRWQGVLGSALMRGRPGRQGLPPAEADRLAGVVLAGIEGALLLARVRRDITPLIDAGDALATLVSGAVSPVA